MTWPRLTGTVYVILLQEFHAARGRRRAAAALELAWVEMVQRDELLDDLVRADTPDRARFWATEFTKLDRSITEWTEHARALAAEAA